MVTFSEPVERVTGRVSDAAGEPWGAPDPIPGTEE